MNSLSCSRTALVLPRRAAARGRVARGYRTPTVAVAASGVATVRFRVKREMGFGDKLAVVGSADLLGKWDVSKALELAWTDGHVWEGKITIPSGSDVEFKCVAVRGGQTEWESGDNRSLKIESEMIEVETVWDAAAQKDKGRRDEKRRDKDRDRERSSVTSVQAAVYMQAPSDVELATVGRWQGRDVNFMR